MNFIRNSSLFVALFVACSIVIVPHSHAQIDDSFNIGNINSNVEVSDPIEPLNRGIYEFNLFVDKILLKPVAKAYKKVVPEIARRGVTNALDNLTEPVTFLNAVLQADPDRAFTSFWRFAINTTWGIGGLGDVAGDAGLKYRKEDYGQTAGVYGMGEGPYLMLPLLGPSNGRDVFGRVVDAVTDPFNYTFSDDAITGRSLISGLDARTNTLDLIDEIDRVSLDSYAAIRSLYTQKRKDDINNGAR